MFCGSVFMGNVDVPTQSNQPIKMAAGTYEFGANLVTNSVSHTVKIVDIALRSVCSELMSSAFQSVRQTACSEQPERTIVFCHLLLFCLQYTFSMSPSLNGECEHRFAQSEQKIHSPLYRVHILSQSQNNNVFRLDPRCLTPEMQCLLTRNSKDHERRRLAGQYDDWQSPYRWQTQWANQVSFLVRIVDLNAAYPEVRKSF